MPRVWNIFLLSIAIVFAIIELLALFVGTKLTRSITSAVAQLYEATKHINRADFSHRITVRSNDQLATLANSFNSMTTSIEKLVQEQKEKQRPRGRTGHCAGSAGPALSEVDSHTWIRGSPWVLSSGANGERGLLRFSGAEFRQVDVGGRRHQWQGNFGGAADGDDPFGGAGLQLEDVPSLRETIAVAAGGSGLMLASESRGRDASPAALLTLLNHQLYESTPDAKYATLLVGIYDGTTHRFTYSNGGHLPPILISEDGSSRLLDCGGTVVGLFDNLSFSASDGSTLPWRSAGRVQ